MQTSRAGPSSVAVSRTSMMVAASRAATGPSAAGRPGREGRDRARRTQEIRAPPQANGRGPRRPLGRPAVGSRDGRSDGRFRRHGRSRRDRRSHRIRRSHRAGRSGGPYPARPDGPRHLGHRGPRPGDRGGPARPQDHPARRPPGAPAPTAVPPAPAGVVQAATTVPRPVYDAVGAPAPAGPAPTLLVGPAAAHRGRPAGRRLRRRGVLPVLRGRAMGGGDRPGPLRDLLAPRGHLVGGQPGLPEAPPPSPSTGPPTRAAT